MATHNRSFCPPRVLKIPDFRAARYGFVCPSGDALAQPPLAARSQSGCCGNKSLAKACANGKESNCAAKEVCAGSSSTTSSSSSSSSSCDSEGEGGKRRHRHREHRRRKQSSESETSVESGKSVEIMRMPTQTPTPQSSRCGEKSSTPALTSFCECSVDELPGNRDKLRVMILRTDTKPPRWCAVPVDDFVRKFAR